MKTLKSNIRVRLALTIVAAIGFSTLAAGCGEGTGVPMGGRVPELRVVHVAADSVSLIISNPGSVDWSYVGCPGMLEESVDRNWQPVLDRPNTSCVLVLLVIPAGGQVERTLRSVRLTPGMTVRVGFPFTNADHPEPLPVYSESFKLAE
mgnify:CR=1 FL=1